MNPLSKNWLRLKQTLAWKLFPNTQLDLRTPKKLIAPIRYRGDFASYQEIFVYRVYDNYFQNLGGVRGWLDLGCNCGFFSLALSEYVPRAEALLVDANHRCLKVAGLVREFNQTPWQIEHGLIGPKNTRVPFYEQNSSIRSSIYDRTRRSKAHTYDTMDLRKAWNRSNIANPDLVKIDIEGAEEHLLREESDFLNQFEFGILEWHSPHCSGAEVKDWISRQGHQVLIVDGMSGGTGFDDAVGMVMWRNPRKG